MRLTEWTMEEVEQLIHFMTTNTWPYDVEESTGRALVERTVEEGGYESDDVKTFWAINEKDEKVGIVKLYDLLDELPIFDLRIADEYRGRGYGTKTLRALTEYVFRLPDEKMRLEGHIRQDHLVMRKTFERVGFVKEAHLRNAWFSPKENKYYDAVTYGMTREDFMKSRKDGSNDSHRAEEEMIRFTPLETERLRLVPPALSSVEAMTKLLNEAESLKEWFVWAQSFWTEEEVEQRIRKQMARFALHEQLTYQLIEKETGIHLGEVSLKTEEPSIPTYSLQFWLQRSYEGRGFMTEAIDRIVTFAFEQSFARRVQIACDEEHVVARALAERLGFKKEGVLMHHRLSADENHLRNTVIYARIE